jgi:two-component sensor histidine kinase
MKMSNVINMMQHSRSQIATPHYPAAIERYEILDTPPEPAFDRFAALAAGLFNAPIALIGFRDGDRLWFKAHHGLALDPRRDTKISASAVEQRVRREHNLNFFVAAPLQTPAGHELGMLCVVDRQYRKVREHQTHHLQVLADVVVDHLEMRLAKRRAIAHAGALMDEANHRIMNSLQFVSSCLKLQTRTAGAEIVAHLTAASTRVLAVARVHGSLLRSGRAEHIQALAFLRGLCADLSQVLNIQIAVTGSDAILPASKIFAIGVITNELVTNAKKHGSAPIEVAFGSSEPGICTLRVLNDGERLSETFSLHQGSDANLGLKIVDAQVQELGGNFSAGPSPSGRGACFRVAFPVG